MYDPLYNENIGLGGFRCRDCKRVTRTLRGILAHLRSVHGIKIQMEMFDATNGKIQSNNKELCPAQNQAPCSVGENSET